MKFVLRFIGAVVMGAALLATASPLAQASPQLAPHASGTEGQASAVKVLSPRLSAAELAQWRQLTATPAGRAKMLSDLQSAFGGVAVVAPAGPGASGPVAGAGLRPNLATGITGDHFWIIVSYADVVDGAIWAGVRACQTKLPSWLCTEAGNLLSSWAAGWGSANNHGVWAAIYWWPPHITGGRW